VTGNGLISLEQVVIALTRPVEDEVADRLDVRQLLDQLPADERELLRLRYFKGASFADIGRQLNIEEGTARTQFFRVLIRLRTLFGTRDGHE
jgi:RNA polymerase sigma-70 factor (ECF subfamily)